MIAVATDYFMSMRSTYLHSMSSGVSLGDKTTIVDEAASLEHRPPHLLLHQRELVFGMLGGLLNIM